jgi:hypothetical protein
MDACPIELGRSSLGRHATDNNFGSAIRSTFITRIRAFKRSMKLSRVQGVGLVRLVFFFRRQIFRVERIKLFCKLDGVRATVPELFLGYQIGSAW